MTTDLHGLTHDVPAGTGRRAFVTGATGFVGSHVAEVLKASGSMVRLLVRDAKRVDRDVSDSCELAEGALTAGIGRDNAATVDALARAMEGCDEVYHVAGLIGAVRQVEFDDVNVTGTRNVVEAIAKLRTRPRRLLLVSSLAAIGPAESPERPTREDEAPHPQTMYGRSKLEGERLAFKLCGEKGIPLTVVRPPAVYGPRDRGILEFFQFMARGIEVGFGRERRFLDLIHGRDLARGIVMAARSEATVGQAYFVTDEGKHEFRAVMAALREVIKPSRKLTLIAPVWLVRALSLVNDQLQKVRGKVIYPNTDKLNELLPTCWCADGSKARRDFGFQSYVPLLEGLGETARWYESRGWIKVRR